MSDKTVLAEGMQLLLRHVEEELTRALVDERRMAEALTLAQARCAGLVEKRDKILEVLAPLMGVTEHNAPSEDDKTVVTLTAHQQLAPATHSFVFTSGLMPRGRSPREWRGEVLGRIERLLADGRRLTTKAIHEELQQQGVDFSGFKNPVHRLVQIMSESPLFHSDRSKGWSLASLNLPAIDDDLLTATAEVRPAPNPADDDS